MKPRKRARGKIAHCTGIDLRERSGGADLKLASGDAVDVYALERRDMCKLYMRLREIMSRAGCVVVPIGERSGH